MKKPVIAAQLFTVRNLLNGKSEEEIRKVLTSIRDIGYQSIQISGVGEITLEVANIYQKIASELKLDICATHFSLDYMEENLDWIIKVHKKWNCKYAGVGAMPKELRTLDKLDIFIFRMNELGKKLKKEGIQLIYHNHKFEFEKINNETWLDYFLNNFNPEYVQLELDTYWIQAGGANPVKWINKVAGNIGIIHLKDMRIVEDEQQFAEIGQGNLDWNEIFKAIYNANVKYAAVEQDSFTNDPLKSLKISYEYLSKLCE